MQPMNSTTNAPQFEVGQLVHHRKYGYRGVVASHDPYCRASESWYRRNRTQPRRDQTWYHVLVDGGKQTYVAEENLELDGHGTQVDHPYVPHFFAAFLSGKYHRFSPN